jgi:hypothetical protein
MLVSDVVTRVLRQFGDEASVQIEEADIIRYINDGIREIVTRNDIGQTTGTINSVVDEDEYNVPADLMSMRTLYYDNERLKFLSKAEFDEYIIAQDPNQIQRGTPFIWTKWASQFILYPKPDSIKVVKLQYLRKPTEVTASGDTLPVASEYYNRVIEYCLQQAYQTDEDWDAATQMNAQFSDGLTRLTQQETFADSNQYYPVVTVLPEDSGY